MPPVNPSEAFRPIPAALCERVCRHARELRDAKTVPDQLRALFMAHAQLKDAEGILPENNPPSVSKITNKAD